MANTGGNDIRIRIRDAFEQLRAPSGDHKLEILRRLLADFNYQSVLNEPIQTEKWPPSAREVVADKGPGSPQVLARAGRGGAFAVVYCPLKRGERAGMPLRLTAERLVAHQLLREESFPECLLIFSDPDQQYWHFVNPRRIKAERREGQATLVRYILRRISVGPEDKLRTAIERFSLLRLTDDEADALPAPQILDRHKEAFNVEQVTQEFYAEFEQRFKELQNALYKQKPDWQWAHDYALQLLSRMMFVYFIQRKRWLGDNPHFMAEYWLAYCRQPRPAQNCFLDQWLDPLFFEAFAGPAEGANLMRREHLPPEIRQTLRQAPYLNGGLFHCDKLDRERPANLRLPDELFARLFDPENGFFERYNFTIAEDSPLDEEVAVDPEMIGRVYERLVNVSKPGPELAQGSKRRHEAGIFYTPRIEIDLMCRLALADYLRHHLDDSWRNLIYELVFALEPDEKEQADVHIAQKALWPGIESLLRRVTVVDPACGSGSFLVGMMNILCDLRQRAARQQHREADERALKREIIRDNLYGVDVMPWAVKIAELRLWLQLIVYSDFAPSERQGPRPLLPNLSFKILPGDSLVQELGGLNLAYWKKPDHLPYPLRQELEQLQEKKRRYYETGGDDAEADAIRVEERQFFLKLLMHQKRSLEQELQRLNTQLNEQKSTLEGETNFVITGKEREEREAERDALQAELERVQQAREAFDADAPVPFIWDLAFEEIFSGEGGGFDIVIGNPPYVRQERIGDPTRPLEEQSAEERARYRQALQRSVYAAFPHFFGPNPNRPRITLDGRSDLYVYFYFHGLRLLNERGVFCFITSNSWLDVGFGAKLQEFLARQVPMHLIIDNEARRSFSQAEINTVITLFGAPRKEPDAALAEQVRFVMVRVPFEEILHPVIFEEIDEPAPTLERPEFRVRTVPQKALLEQGMRHGTEKAEPAEVPRKGRKKGHGPLIQVGKYAGEKWGGKYLRAPAVYDEILKAAGDKLVPLEKIAKVRRGLTTNANEFFYVRPAPEQSTRPEMQAIVTKSGEMFLLPKEMLRPAIVNVRHVRCPELTRAEADYLLVCIPPRPLAELPAEVREYVKWGEGKGFHQQPSLAGKRYWYAMTPREGASVLWPIVRDRQHLLAWNAGALQADHNFVEVWPESTERPFVIAGSLLSSFTALEAELFGRTNLGGGCLKVEKMDSVLLHVVAPERIGAEGCAALEAAFDRLRRRPILTVYDEARQEDRQALDDAFLAAIGITDARRRRELGEALRDELCRIVWQRLAKTGKGREATQTYEEWKQSGEPYGEAPEEDESEEDL